MGEETTDNKALVMAATWREIVALAKELEVARFKARSVETRLLKRLQDAQERMSALAGETDPKPQESPK